MQANDIPVAEITPILAPKMVPLDMLRPSRSLVIKIGTECILPENEGRIFELNYPGKFVFSLFIEKGFIVFSRGNSIIRINLVPFSKNVAFTIFAMWDTKSICLNVNNIIKEKTDTEPLNIPFEVFQWVQKKNLSDVIIYESEEELASKGMSCLESISDKLEATEVFSSFWDITYKGDGKSIARRTPKKEPNVHPVIEALLIDQLMMAGIQVTREYRTPRGNVDFAFTGCVKGLGPRKIFVEVKNAHAADLEHGLEDQLPLYMKISHVKYGAYIILDYRGEWFDSPVSDEKKCIESYMKNRFFQPGRDEVHNRIRLFVYGVGKQPSASKI